MAIKTINNKQKAALAYDLYMNTDYSQKEICSMIDWSEKTFTQHKNKGNWEELKGALQLTPQKIIRNLYNQMYELSKDSSNLQADKLIKLAHSIEKLTDKNVTISNIINVFKEFTTFCYDRDAELAKRINEIQQEFVNYKINTSG